MKPALFLHIQKTAGSTIVDLAKIAYGVENVMSHGDYVLEHGSYISNFGSDDLGIVTRSFEDLRKVPFISGHFGFDFAKQLMSGRYTFTFLRDPIERILSFYYFCITRDPRQFEIYDLAQQLSLYEFLSLGLTYPPVKDFIWNNQTWQLALGFANEKLEPLANFSQDEILTRALQHLDDFSHIGFAESFEQDRDKILTDLGIQPPNGRVVSNASVGRPTARDLPKKTKDLLYELTHLDRQLYKEAWSRRDGLLNRYLNTMQKNTGTQSPSHYGELEKVKNRYLELLQLCLTGSIYRDASLAPFGSKTFDPKVREHGLDWPAHAQTMIGDKRLANLRMLTESVLEDNVPGDFIETGVWRGGACILMRAVLFAHGETGRKVWVADSFEGLPPANESQYPADAGSDFHAYKELAISLEEVQENFRAYGLLDDQTRFLKGWFKDTLPTAPIKQLALMRLDGDMYESTMDALNSLYPKLSSGGYVIIDDYHVVPACKDAVHDYCRSIGIQPEIIEIDGVGVYWRKIGASNIHTENEQGKQKIAPSVDQIATLKQAISDLNETIIMRLLDTLNEHDATIAKLTLAVSERDADVVKLNQDVVKLNQHAANLGDELKRVYASKSWRITKPLRQIQGVINKR